ncbi:sucrose operon repressor [Arthrobacter sp. Hiyo1]|nr:sucrose operon repressor [Arthrobacter sp. Hiyo1]
MSAKLTDVAKLAGVSLATASRAFGDPGRLAAETRQKVMAAAEQLGYDVPGVTGSRTFGVIVPDISNAVFAALIKAIQDQAWHGRHRMVLADTSESSSRERAHLESFATGVDGIILCSPRLPSEQIHDLAGSAPLVVINGEAEHAARVLMEAGEGIRQASSISTPSVTASLLTFPDPRHRGPTASDVQPSPASAPIGASSLSPWGTRMQRSTADWPRRRRWSPAVPPR